MMLLGEVVYGDVLSTLFYGLFTTASKLIIRKVGVELGKRNGPLVHKAKSNFSTVEVSQCNVGVRFSKCRAMRPTGVRRCRLT